MFDTAPTLYNKEVINMTKFINRNAHAMRFTTKVGRIIKGFNVPAGAEVEIPGDGIGLPSGLVKVTKPVSKKAAKKAVKKPVVKAEPKKDSKTDE